MEDVRHEVSLLKPDKFQGPDGLHPSLFKEGGQSLMTSLKSSLRTVWTKEQIPRKCNHSTFIPVYKKDARNLCESHRGISLVTVAYNCSRYLTYVGYRTSEKDKSVRIGLDFALNEAVATIILP